MTDPAAPPVDSAAPPIRGVEGAAPPPRLVPPGLHLVSVPIGALRDITLRALDTLAAADLVACEDTRVTGRLMAAFGLKAPLLSYHDHNADTVRPKLLARLAAGQTVALVSDAGTPLVSDPGFKLVRDAVAAGHPVTAAPGPSALLPAVQLAAVPSERFAFLGFLPAKAGDRDRLLAAVAGFPGALALYEAAPRLAATLDALAAALGDRNAAVCRELTKRFEEVRRDRLSGLAAAIAAEGPPKGEIVIVVGPGEAPGLSAEDVDTALAEAVARVGVKQAAAEVAAMTGQSKRDLYQRALALAAKG